MKSYPVTIVGATGLVGTTLLALLEERSFPVEKLFLVASQQSAGKEFTFRGQSQRVYDLASFDFSQSKITFFCIRNELAAQYVPKAAAAGNIVFDKSDYYRNDPTVPLVVPEVNIDALQKYSNKNIIASPNCNTIPIAVGLKPIYDAVGIARVNVATYQSVSGTGKDAMAELTEQTKQLLSSQPIHPRVYSQQIAFNVLPHIDEFTDNGYTKEEMKIVWEMRKIFDDETLAINPTAVRVPVFCGHAASVHLETKDKLSAEAALALLSTAPGVELMTGKYPYPTPALDAAGKDPVYCRVREDISCKNGLNL